MGTKQMLYNHLQSKGAFTETLPEILTITMSVIQGEVPKHLKLSIALSELITLTSHLRKPIELYDGTLVPTNAITFALAASGIAKDSSMNMVRKALSKAYAKLLEKRKVIARKRAEKLALLEGGTTDDWQAHYQPPRDLQPGLGTVEGLILHLAELESDGIGAGYIHSSEIGSDLTTNPTLIDIIKTISVGYDLGKIPTKMLRAAENQIQAIQSLPINALLFGSQDAILFDNTVKQKFRTVFSTQLARRSIFSYISDKPKRLEFSSVKQLEQHRENERNQSLESQSLINDYLAEIVDETTTEPLRITKEAQSLFDVYKEYNLRLSDEIRNQFPITKLSRSHKQWLALKLSGNYAILDKSEVIEASHYIDALNTIEILANDLYNFERELTKEPYEAFVDYCKTNAEDGCLHVTIHQLRKLGFVTGQSVPKQKLEELIYLVTAYDTENIYTIDSNGIYYEEPKTEATLGVSYILYGE